MQGETHFGKTCARATGASAGEEVPERSTFGKDVALCRSDGWEEGAKAGSPRPGVRGGQIVSVDSTEPSVKGGIPQAKARSWISCRNRYWKVETSMRAETRISGVSRYQCGASRKKGCSSVRWEQAGAGNCWPGRNGRGGTGKARTALGKYRNEKRPIRAIEGQRTESARSSSQYAMGKEFACSTKTN